MASSLPADQKRIGVFGGAFDPPHNAHVALAKAAIAQLALQELRVVPTGHAWHKARALSSAAHRLAMTELAFQGLPQLVVDTRELHRPGPTFTIDTLQALQAEHPHARLYLIMGADQFATFQQWHRWQDIVRLATICIAGRAPFTAAPAVQLDEGGAALKNHFLQLQLPAMAVSATQVRQLCLSGAATHEALTKLVPEAVARYISTHDVYGIS